jgi:hypothetical protein
MNAKVLATTVLILLALASVEQALGQEEEEKKVGWSNVADLGLVVTGGNSNTSTLTFDDKLTRTWQNATLQFRFGGLRTNTTDDRIAIITGPEDFAVIDDVSRELDTERYSVNGSYRRDVNQKLFWIAGAGWLRDLNTGIQNMTAVYGGLGNTWWDREDSRLLTDYSITYANREEEIKDPLLDGQFPALRLSLDYMNQFGSNSQYDNDFTILPNLKNLEDYQFDWTNSVTSNLTNLLALRVSLQLLYRNIPGLEVLDLFTVPPSEAPSLPIGTVPVRRKKLDTLFKVTLVVTL